MRPRRPRSHLPRGAGPGGAADRVSALRLGGGGPRECPHLCRLAPALERWPRVQRPARRHGSHGLRHAVRHRHGARRGPRVVRGPARQVPRPPRRAPARRPGGAAGGQGRPPPQPAGRGGLEEQRRHGLPGSAARPARVLPRAAVHRAAARGGVRLPAARGRPAQAWQRRAAPARGRGQAGAAGRGPGDRGMAVGGLRRDGPHARGHRRPRAPGHPRGRAAQPRAAGPRRLPLRRAGPTGGRRPVRGELRRAPDAQRGRRRGPPERHLRRGRAPGRAAGRGGRAARGAARGDPRGAREGAADLRGRRRPGARPHHRPLRAAA
mmetsp:Transcript_61036/g.158411  ORF Transcript_61036/g.158411 Transcript_61036/m.158411 type:complete len:322 (-) Transcript_61036:415-1380(-)